MRNGAWAVIVATVLSGVAVPARAVIVLSSDSTSATRNTTAPTSASSAYKPWNYTGTWGDFTGTAIGSSSFITAKHIGGLPGHIFAYQGVNYTALNYADVAGTDLRVWTVDGTFPEYAQLYNKPTDSTASAIVVGRGTDVGAAVYVTNPSNGQQLLRGWLWGNDDRARSWGPATMIGVANSDVGQLLAFSFQPSKGMITGGDSGGGVFVLDGADWKLAGVSYSVSGPYKYSASDPTAFSAAIFNERLLYVPDGSGGFVQETANVAGNSYASRIYSHVSEIQALVPEPGSALALAGSLLLLARRRRA